VQLVVAQLHYPSTFTTKEVLYVHTKSLTLQQHMQRKPGRVCLLTHDEIWLDSLVVKVLGEEHEHLRGTDGNPCVSQVRARLRPRHTANF
jgi:hypothetical protein